jgi:hypothetical protein
LERIEARYDLPPGYFGAKIPSTGKAVANHRLPKLTIQRYGIFNPYTGRGAIKGHAAAWTSQRARRTRHACSEADRVLRAGKLRDPALANWHEEKSAFLLLQKVFLYAKVSPPPRRLWVGIKYK